MDTGDDFDGDTKELEASYEFEREEVDEADDGKYHEEEYDEGEH